MSQHPVEAIEVRRSTPHLTALLHSTQYPVPAERVGSFRSRLQVAGPTTQQRAGNPRQATQATGRSTGPAS
jgi:hypothetical protein